MQTVGAPTTGPVAKHSGSKAVFMTDINQHAPTLSIIITAYQDAAAIPALAQEIADCMQAAHVE